MTVEEPVAKFDLAAAVIPMPEPLTLKVEHDYRQAVVKRRLGDERQLGLF